MADGSDQYIETRYSNEKPILEGPKAGKKYIAMRGAQLGKSRIEGPNSEIRHSEWGPKRQKILIRLLRGAQLVKSYLEGPNSEKRPKS